MKKLIIAAAIVCAAVASQASSVSWTSTAAPYFFNTAALDGNKGYSAGTTMMKDAGQTFAYTLVVANAGEASGTVGFNAFTGGFMNQNLTVGGDTAISAGQSYNYTITITTSLAGIGEQDGWDYTAATATTVLSGSFTGASGSSPLQSSTPSTWTVTGAVQTVPEPTSGLLLLLGVAGMALRRRRA